MNDYVSNKLYSGDAQIFIPVTKKYRFMHDGDSKITDGNGFPLKEIGKSPGIINVNSPLGFWAIEFQDAQKTYTKADDVPLEVGIKEQPDIMTRMRQMIQAEVMNRYGENSRNVETLEEALDFDIDGDGEIGYTAAEIAAMPDEELIEMGLVRTQDPESLEEAPTDIDGVSIQETTPEEPPPAV